MRIGFGHDIHRLVAGEKLIIGGKELDYDKGFEAHSDGDVLYHALVDALLGALALGDIGSHFPNNEEKWKNKASEVFLRYAHNLVKEKNYTIANIDMMVHAEAPKMNPHIFKMRQHTAEILQLDIDQVSIKAGTNESCDAVGRGEAIEAQAIVLLEKNN